MSFQTLFSQIDSVFIIIQTEERIDTVSKAKLSEIELHYYEADLSPWKCLKDSGSLNLQNEKHGNWIEYPIDTTILSSKSNVKTQSSIYKVFEPEIVKYKGEYINGKKSGLWKRYNAGIRTKPFFWSLDRTNEYQNNMKNGKEIWFEPFSKDTMMMFIYRDNEPIKQIK